MLKAISARTGLEFKQDREAHIGGQVNALERGGADVTMLIPTLGREDRFRFSRPFVQTAFAIITRDKPGEPDSALALRGKSTLLRVMSRLYAPVEGQMFSDGLDVNQIDPADWRKTVGFVSQEARLFYGSLRENVMIGKPEATAEEFLRVLRLTGLDHIAGAHPRGINLPIGEMGEGVSGGQRQLISLARTLLSRPKLLLMDEPTSAMDSQTEALFLDHLKRAMEGQTLVVVTHRPSVLSLVDRIIVVDGGKIVADGPKANVMAALANTANAAEAAPAARSNDAHAAPTTESASAHAVPATPAERKLPPPSMRVQRTNVAAKEAP